MNVLLKESIALMFMARSSERFLTMIISQIAGYAVIVRL